jgi:hypothetical protein
MKTKLLIAPALLASSMGLSACAENYAAEGALGGAALGAGVAAVTGEDIETFALAGAAAGGVAGYFVDKDDDCDGYYDDEYLDDDCFGTAGYPADPRY